MSTYTPIASITLSASTSSVTFSGIPQTYSDLVLVVNGLASSECYVRTRFNGDTASNYSGAYMAGNGTSAFNSRYSNASNITHGAAGNSFNIIDIQNYSNTTTFKTTLTKSGRANDQVQAMVGLWRSTAAITSITVYSDVNSYNQGSTFNLYAIDASVSAQAKATGGDSITTDGTYWYHTFLSSGTFTPTEALTADYLVVAGGGGGGQNNGGGGGAGGLQGFSSQTLTAQNYTVTIGAGGAGSPSNAENGVSGSNSSFGSSTASLGGGGAGSYTTLNGSNGGSGGGGGASAEPGFPSGTGGIGEVGQGNNGGNGQGASNPNHRGGGGGGAGSAGVSAASLQPDGGTGSSNYSTWGAATFTGQNSSGTYYYAGGGGGARSNTTGGNGGLGGGGNGGGAVAQSNGSANTGGGGGGAPNQGAGAGLVGASGGSGIIIVRYPV